VVVGRAFGKLEPEGAAPAVVPRRDAGVGLSAPDPGALFGRGLVGRLGQPLGEPESELLAVDHQDLGPVDVLELGIDPAFGEHVEERSIRATTRSKESLPTATSSARSSPQYWP